MKARVSNTSVNSWHHVIGSGKQADLPLWHSIANFMCTLTVQGQDFLKLMCILQGSK